MIAAPAPETIERLKSAVGERGWSQDPGLLAPLLVEWRARWSGETPLLLTPKTVDEVSAIVRICAETGTALTPQGGNTGLVGGQIPQGEILLSLQRMNRILEIDAADGSMTVEAGVTLAGVHEAAKAAGLRFPLSLASEGSCTIGGNVSTNAGGTAVLRYGSMRDLVLGLQAVLPNGEIWTGLGRPRKDNTGYDLKHLLCGAEGTLGIVTAATLKLFPLPASRAVAYAGVSDPADVLKLLERARAVAGPSLEAFEIISRLGVELALRHIPNMRDPLAEAHTWYVLLEIASQEAEAAERMMEAALTVAFEEELISDAVIAQSETQAAEFWALRENQSAAQKMEGPAWKHDIAVPVGSIPAFLERAGAALEAFCPGVRIPAFGHVGDGNLHYDVLHPVGGDLDAHNAAREDAAAVVNDVVVAMGGSISAEHGIGVMKVEEALRYKSPAEIATYRAIRSAIDPHRIMNPRVLF